MACCRAAGVVHTDWRKQAGKVVTAVEQQANTVRGPARSRAYAKEGGTTCEQRSDGGYDAGRLLGTAADEKGRAGKGCRRLETVRNYGQPRNRGARVGRK